MNYPAARLDLERFRAVIVQQTGLQFDDARLGFLDEVLQRRLKERGHSSGTYLRGMECAALSGEIDALARELTVGETYFFRNIEQFRALAEIVLPACLARTPKALRILSAGCASGEEPYTLAITARETIGDPACEVTIRAIDLNPAALKKAARACYSSWALRETPADIQRKWFRASGRDMILDESIRTAVQFECGNLADESSSLWRPASHDVIFCRNVLMYFAPEQMRAVIARMAQSLAPGGFLFLGHAETLRGISDRFHLRHSHATFYYQLKEGGEPARERPAEVPSRPSSAVAVARPQTDWFDTIRQASERVAALVPGPSASNTRAGPVAGPRAVPFDPAPALELLRKERFNEALDYIRSRPPAADPSPELLLLEAALLVHSGRLAAAERVCRGLLLIDEFNADARYILGLCCEHARAADRAADQYRVAVYLDPEFAMPRLHLGLLARRAGDWSAARREFGQALFLLGHEDASRLLLFGGGFSREALVALAESALRECGAQQ